jgi:hypothetical protein
LKNVQFCSRSRKTKISTTGIHLVFRGLKFESDAEVGKKGIFFKALLIVTERAVARPRPLNKVQFWPRSRKAKISTAGIYGIFRGLKFEPEEEIGQKGHFSKVSSFLCFK